MKKGLSLFLRLFISTMSLLSDLINLNLSDTSEKVIAEYIWLAPLSLFIYLSRTGKVCFSGWLFCTYEQEHTWQRVKYSSLLLPACFYVTRNVFWGEMFLMVGVTYFYRSFVWSALRIGSSWMDLSRMAWSTNVWISVLELLAFSVQLCLEEYCYIFHVRKKISFIGSITLFYSTIHDFVSSPLKTTLETFDLNSWYLMNLNIARRRILSPMISLFPPLPLVGVPYYVSYNLVYVIYCILSRCFAPLFNICWG